MTSQTIATKSHDTDIQVSRDTLCGRGLCRNCAHAGACGILASATTAVVQCELYECCSQPRPKLVGPSNSRVQAQQLPQGVHLLGLCVNCDHRAECRLPKSAAGVWHCEQYR